MTRRNRPVKSDPEEDPTKGPIIFPGSGGGRASVMRIIVPLQGVVQGRGGLVLGSLIPCALFYLLQLYLKRIRASPPSPPSSPAHSSQLPEEGSSSGLHRTLSRTLLSPRGSAGQPATVSVRALTVARSCDSVYAAGLLGSMEDPYDALHNPHGVFQLGLAENRLSLDLVENWLEENAKEPIFGRGLSINEIATYQPHDGLMDLKMAVVDFMSLVMQGSVSLNPSNIVLTAGAASAIENLCFCLADAGNAFLVPSPYHPCFDEDLKWRTGVEIIPIPCRSANGFNLSITALDRSFNQAKKRGQKVCGVIISNPSNTTGSLLDRKTLHSLMDFVRAKNIHLISNELYVTSGEEFVSVAEIIGPKDSDRDRVHIVYDLSTDLSLPGLMTGVIHSFNENAVSAAMKLARFSSVSAVTQWLIGSVLSDTVFVQRFVTTSRQRVRARRAEFVAGLKEMGIECARDSGGLCCWADMSGFIRSYGEKGEMELWGKLRDMARIIVTPGSSCHCMEPGWFGLCFSALSERDIALVMDRIGKVTDSVKPRGSAL